MASDRLIHLFEKNGFNYVLSVGDKGQGPQEITNIGLIGVNDSERLFYVSDHGKQKNFSFHLDSVLSNSLYEPKEKMNMDEKQFPDKYHYINDTLCIGLIIEPIGTADFKQSVAKWDMISFLDCRIYEMATSGDRTKLFELEKPAYGKIGYDSENKTY